MSNGGGERPPGGDDPESDADHQGSEADELVDEDGEESFPASDPPANY